MSPADDPMKVLRHRMAMMAITLDGADAPPRARLVWSPVNHGGQPVDPDADVFTTGVRLVDVITLVAIADLYGVPRGYLTAPGADPGREAMIDEDFFRIRTTTPRPRHAITYEYANRAPVPTPAPAEIAAVSDTARQIAQAATQSAVPWILAGLAAGTAGTIGLAAIATTFTWVLAGLLGGFTFARTVYAARRDARRASWVHADDATFTNELQQHLRDSIARHFHTLHTQSRLPLEQLVAILESTTPIGTVQLDALTGGDTAMQRTLIVAAVDNAMHVHGYRVGRTQFR
jgi:hypothetical protein